MEKQIKNAISWIKEVTILDKPINGCITGSCMLDTYWEGMDIDIFVYSSEEFINVLWKLYYDNNFQLLEPTEIWKFDRFVKESSWQKENKLSINTIKFMWNTCIPVNIIFKNNKKTIFDVLSSFDIDIVALGYDLRSGKYLDLGDEIYRADKIALPNKWNTEYDNPTIWSVSKMLRQVGRIIKYYNRGYNTDPIVLKYIELIDKILEDQNIFNSPKYDVLLKTAKTNFTLIKDIFKAWLDTHTITKKTLELIETKIKEI